MSASDSGEIYREKNYSIWKTRYGNFYYVYKDGYDKSLYDSTSYEDAVRFIKEKLK